MQEQAIHLRERVFMVNHSRDPRTSKEAPIAAGDLRRPLPPRRSSAITQAPTYDVSTSSTDLSIRSWIRAHQQGAAEVGAL